MPINGNQLYMRQQGITILAVCYPTRIADSLDRNQIE